jgi:CxxC-x17-CxxC domain-containing protein
MEFSDRTLTCIDCGQPFVFSAGEQLYFSEKHFRHDPKHCKACRAKRANRPMSLETTVTCAACGATASVPFRPRQDRPVLCRVCFHRQRAEASVPTQVLGQVEAVEDRGDAQFYGSGAPPIG